MPCFLSSKNWKNKVQALKPFAGAAIYFIVPTDAVPDFLPFIGYGVAVGLTSNRRVPLIPDFLPQIVNRHQFFAVFIMPEGPAIAAWRALRGGAHFMNAA